MMRRILLAPLVALALWCVFVDGARGDGKVSMTGLSLYSEKCAQTLTRALEKVDGVSELSVNLKQQKATCTLRDKQAHRSLDAALQEAGFHCDYSGDRRKGVRLGFVENLLKP